MSANLYYLPFGIYLHTRSPSHHTERILTYNSVNSNICADAVDYLLHTQKLTILILVPLQLLHPFLIQFFRHFTELPLVVCTGLPTTFLMLPSPVTVFGIILTAWSACTPHVNIGSGKIKLPSVSSLTIVPKAISA